MGVYIPYIPRLPSEYQEVEYIQSSGTQYINTGFIPDNNSKLELSMGGWNNGNLTGIIFGVRSSWSTDASTGRGFLLAGGISQDTWYGGMFGRRYSGSGDNFNVFNFVDGGDYILALDQSGFYQNGTKKYTPATVTFTSPSSIYLFMDNDNGTAKEPTSYKLYYCKIWGNGTLVRDFVPCYRKSDSVVGLYDLVNNQFYTNAGSGTFSKGNDVTMTELKNAYIGEYKGWQPNENTLIYYPLTSDLKDVMGNGNTGTAHGNVTFNATDGGTSGCRVIGMNNIYVTGMSLGINGRLNFTLNFRAKYDSNSTNSSACIVGYGTNTQDTQCFKTESYSWQSPVNIRFLLHGTVTTTGHTNITSSNVNLYLGNWYNYCITMKNGVCKMFINGNQIQFYSGSGPYDSVTFSSVNNISELQLGWGGTYGSSRSANGYVRDYIVETIGWEDSFVKDYFDYTKHKVGL